MNLNQAQLSFGNDVKVPKFQPGGLLLSGDKIFYTLQAEGATIGRPAIFIRLQNCNLSCNWKNAGGSLCDAFYTWDTTSKDYWTSSLFLPFADILKEVQKYPQCKRIVITGGEPLLQQTQIIELFNALPKDYIVEIETNGTISPDGLINNLPFEWLDERTQAMSSWRLQINCSPKLSSAGDSVEKRIKIAALRAINAYANSYFKFVITQDSDIDEVKELLRLVHLDNDKVILMPEGISNDVLAQRMQTLAEIAKETGWAVTPRLQIFIWGNKRGT